MRCETFLLVRFNSRRRAAIMLQALSLSGGTEFYCGAHKYATLYTHTLRMCDIRQLLPVAVAPQSGEVGRYTHPFAGT